MRALINTGAWLQEGLLMPLHLLGPCLLGHHLELHAEHSTATWDMLAPRLISSTQDKHVGVLAWRVAVQGVRMS